MEAIRRGARLGRCPTTTTPAPPLSCLEQKDDEAENYYEQAVERAPAWARPHCLAWVDIAMRRGDYESGPKRVRDHPQAERSPGIYQSQTPRESESVSSWRERSLKNPAADDDEDQSAVTDTLS